MKRNRTGTFLMRPVAGFVLSLLLLSAYAAADEESRTREKLDQLKQAMHQLGQELSRDLLERSSMQAALRESEIAIGNIRKDIQTTSTRLQRVRQQLAGLRAQRRELLVARGEQQELIIREIQAAYQMGKQGQLKVLLNQERPDTLARAMAYYEHFYQARQGHIDAYLDTIARIDALEPEIAATSSQLASAQRTLDEQEQALTARQQQRQRELASLEASIESKDQRLQQMDRDREELERLLEVIEQAVAEMEVPEDYQAFAALKGQMPWPVAGRPSNRYGSRRNNASLRWQGLIIPTAVGSRVTAIHHGRVVFADWFRGSGLLLIIDHGDGYMSLYAHNETLLRDVGEWVSAGAAIATVGNSGGREETALYFEIRQGGKPVNPGTWLSRGQ